MSASPVNPCVLHSRDGRSQVAFAAVVQFSRGDGRTEGLTIGPATPSAPATAQIPGIGRVRLARRQASAAGISAAAEVAALDDGRWAARLVVENTGNEAIRLNRLTPVSVIPGSLRLRDIPAAEWTCIRQPRHKNDMPAAFRLGDARPGVLDAVRGTAETGGPPQGGLGGRLPTRFVSSEVTVLGAGDAALLLGVVPAHRQLVSCELRIAEDRGSLEALDVHCEGDGQSLAPGAQIESQWVVVDLERPALDAMAAYADLLAACYRDPNQDRPAPRPPTVWCSWYYYGDGCTQEEAEENLSWLTAQPLPVDVVQIDECWDLHWGDWEPNPDWPDLRGFAQRVRASGREPGLWTCPFLAESRSRLRYRHPDWLLRNAAGDPILFPMNNMQNCVLDPTQPQVLAFLEATFRRLTDAYGFTYHKLDFTRAVADPAAVFHDPARNRAEAYRMGLEAVRRGMGPRSYMNVCGGLYGPALGIANAQRTGSDVKSLWPTPPAGQEDEGYGPFTIKQNTLRFWLNRLGHNDPDALMVRRRPQAYRHEPLSLGLMNDEEALTTALNQYLGGGLVCFTERLAEIDADRLLLLRHGAPSIGRAALPLDAASGARFPSILLTHVIPVAAGLGDWATLAVVNWSASPRVFALPLAEVLAMHLRRIFGPGDWEADGLVAASFRHGTAARLRLGETLTTRPVPAHGCEVIKLQPCRRETAMLVGTDGHFSMGGTEVRQWRCEGDRVEAVVWWPWPAPMALTIGRCGADGSLRLQRLPVADSAAEQRLCVDLGSPIPAAADRQATPRAR